jgi:hypothetical protein
MPMAEAETLDLMHAVTAQYAERGVVFVGRL